MILIYHRLCEKNLVDIYDGKDLVGGAWSYGQLNKARFSNFTNIILPANIEEDNMIPKINEELNNYKCKISLPPVSLRIKDIYKPKNMFIHNFSEFYKDLINKKVILKKNIKTISLNKEKIIIDGRNYDFLFLPSCFKIKNFLINKKNYPINIKTVTSTHVTVGFGKNNVSICSYDDDFDNIFDRVQIRSIKNENIFTGRVRKSFKSKDINYFIKNSNYLNQLKDLVSYSKINFYDHNIIDEGDILKITKLTKEYPLSIVETRQFNRGYLHLNKSIDRMNLF